MIKAWGMPVIQWIINIPQYNIILKFTQMILLIILHPLCFYYGVQLSQWLLTDYIICDSFAWVSASSWVVKMPIFLHKFFILLFLWLSSAHLSFSQQWLCDVEKIEGLIQNCYKKCKYSLMLKKATHYFKSQGDKTYSPNILFLWIKM